MSKIRIVNFLLTRRCNLNCDYCAIVKDYPGMPIQYPRMAHYTKNEMPTKTVTDALLAFKKHNPKIFIILYGGEPLLRTDLPEIVNFCNENEIYYTVISNNTPEIQPLIKRLFKETDYVDGFTSSVDPIFNDPKHSSKDRIKKSIEGMKRLKEIQAKGDVNDVVAEITVMNENQEFLYELVSDLSKHKIYSDITFLDIAKNPHYDFSNVTSPDQLVKQSWKLANMLSKMMNDDGLYIHMKNALIPQMFDTLPSNFDCELENGIHNVTVDADGTMRLCLRIRGILTPHIHVKDLFENESLVSKEFYDLLCMDKHNYCSLCNHSCLMMSKHIDSHSNYGEDDLVHKDKRED